MALSITNTLSQKTTPLIKIPEKSTGIFSVLSGTPTTSNSTPAVVQKSSTPVASAATIPATAPKATVTPAATSTAQKSSGAYKGVALYGTDQASLQEQMRQIDAQQAPKTTTGGGLVTTPTVSASTASTPSKGLFESVVGSLANPQASKETVRAQKAYEQAVQNLADFELSAADTKKNIYDAPTSARVMQGRDAAVQQANAETRAALQGAIQEQQAAIGFGQTQQSLNQAAQQAAAGFASPSPTSFGQTVFNPLTGTFGGGAGTLDPQTVATQLANEVKSGRMTYEQAVSSLGYAGGAGQQFLNSALQGSGFNIPLSSASIAGQQNVYQTLPALTSADLAAEGIKNTIVSYLDANPQINASQLAAGNILSNWLQGKQLADPKIQSFFNYINEYTNTLAPILGVGGDPTNLKTQIAQDFINAAASGQSIKEVLQNMEGLSKTKIANLKTGATLPGNYQGNTGSSGTGTGSIWDF